jgi:hypothetical protein
MPYLPPPCPQGGLRKRPVSCPLLKVLKIRQRDFAPINLRLVPNRLYELQLCILTPGAVSWGEVGVP